jgi:acetyl esterase/lipase
MNRILALAGAAILTALAFLPLAASGSASYKELLARPRNTPDRHIAYGSDALQYGDLYLPKGKTPHPVIVLIHGGCWLAELPGPELMDPMAGALRDHGYAVWSIEYRRIGHKGGGYPGTFEDAGNAVDALRTFAPKHHLDLHRVVLVGHSAGGHLAAWIAARPNIPVTSPLHVSKPLTVRGVVSLSGILDLEAYRNTGGDACGGPSTIDSLVGTHALPYADTSPELLVPSHVPQAIVSGETDRIVAAHFGHDYSAKAKAAGDAISDLEIAGAGHFDLIDPEAPAWAQVLAAIDAVAK